MRCVGNTSAAVSDILQSYCSNSSCPARRRYLQAADADHSTDRRASKFLQMEFKMNKQWLNWKDAERATSDGQKHRVGYSRLMVATNIRMVQSGSRSVGRTASFEML